MNALDPELPAATALPNPFRDPIGVAERHWRWMLAALALGAATSLLAWSRSEPRYFAEATVLVARQSLAERLVEPAGEGNRLSVTEALAAEVLSRSNLTRLVADFALYPGLEGVETMPEIVDRVRSHVTIRAVQRLDSPAADRGESAYSIGFEAATPEAAAGVANRLASLFGETSSQGRLQQQQLTTEFLRRELARAETELGEHTRAVTEFKERHAGMLPDDLESNLARMRVLDDRRQSLALGIVEARTSVASLASAADSPPELQIGRLREELARLRARQTSRHPDVIELERQIAELEQRLDEPTRKGEELSTRGLLLKSEQTLKVLQKQLGETEAGVAELGERIRKMPAVQEEFASLEERGAVLRANYLEVQRKAQDAELGAKLLDVQQGRRVSVLDAAEPPSRPIEAPLRILALGLVASLGFAICVGFGRELLHPVVVSPGEVAGATGLPILGWVSRIR